jgi:hypothetical protein
MNKNRAVIIVIVIGFLGIIIGFLCKENILQKIFSVLLVLAIFATIWDVYNAFRNKKYFGQTKWNVKNVKTNNITLGFAIIIAIIMLSSMLIIPISVNNNLNDTLHTKLFAMYFIVYFIGWTAYLIHSLLPNEINEKGIMYWGVFHTWDDIDSYSFADRYFVITLKPNNKKITFIVDKYEKEMIKNFLKEKLKK